MYALGCVLFEMLTGTPPFTADSDVGVAYRQVHDDPGPPSARRPGLPAQLDWITTRLLAKDPADRPPGAAAARAGLLAALTPGRTAVLAAQPRDARADREQRRPRRPRRTELVLGAALAASLVSLVAVLLNGTTSSSPRAGSSGAPIAASHRQSTGQHPGKPGSSHAGRSPHAARLPPVAAAAAAFVGDLQAGVVSGQVTEQAGQNLFNQLQQLLFRPPDQNAEQVQQQYDQLVQVYDRYEADGQITGRTAVELSHALDVLRTAVGAR